MPGIEQTHTLSVQQAPSPLMQRSLQILQASLSELKHLVGNEMRVNPTLEEVTSSRDFSLLGGEPFSLQEEWDTYFVQSDFSSLAAEQHHHLINSLIEASTLQSSLRKEVVLMEKKAGDISIALLIIGSLNEAGYLEASVEEIASLAKACPEDVDAVLRQVQSLDPAGIAARNLQECLLIQLRRQGKATHLESRIVKLCLNQLAHRRFKEIARVLQVPLAQVCRAANHIAQLEPRPGRTLEDSVEPFVTAEVTVRKGRDGEYHPVLNNAGLPRLRINSLYRELLSQEGSNREVREYIQKKIRAGLFLIRSIQKRQQTVLDAAEQIVIRQQKFFEEGFASLFPMTMGEIAKAIGVHETTVSRAVSGKYMDTPHGVLAMRRFFTSGYRTKSGGFTSSESVREEILRIVAGEDRCNPFRDQEIVALLRGRGLLATRRIVAKYRAQLSILPSYLRKKKP
jgi:RNA polymerase sigma-54 factor